MQKIKVLITAYEAAPFYKRGGLGDVMESLPKALNKIGIDTRVVIPYYNDIKKKYHLRKEGEFTINFGFEKESIRVYSSLLPFVANSPQGGLKTKVPFYFLENTKYLFSSTTLGKNKRIDKFAFFSLAVAHFANWVLEYQHFSPSLIHCNDWHTALIPLILRQKMKFEIPTLLTIHNLNYQGVGSLRVLDLLGMKDEETKELKRGKPATEINVLGEGIIHATRVSTVSQSYTKEIADDYTGSRISPFFKKREEERLGKDGRIIGILNGIDYNIWNPKTDDLLFCEYDIDTWEAGKRKNKDNLLKGLGLEDRPTFCFVGRMAKQKGLDVLIKAVDRLESLNINVIILGEGNIKIQENVSKLARKYPSWVKAELIYSEEFAHKFYGASDFIIIPSHYEPCGLIQMIAMRYGALPIASKTGGLKDSIKNNSNGFLFRKGLSRALVKAVKRALIIYKSPQKHQKMVTRAMNTNFSWEKSAKKYKRLYQEILRSF
ncbi:MAG: glycogen/starch synthase [Patescibacteria group bacterium]